MGMDLTGLKPTNSAGKYFHNTIWGWIPLWEYVANECSDILTERDITLGGSNSGHRVSRTKADAIAKRLHSLIGTGKTQAYAEGVHRSSLSRPKAPALANARKVARALGAAAEPPQFSVENVQDFADFCVSSGGFEIS